jgi:uncharacterized phage protein gp47/JayE
MSTDGQISVSVKDSDSIPLRVKFSRPTNVYFWLKITIESYNEEEDFPANGELSIKQSVLNFAKNNFNIGNIVVLQKLINSVYETPGIEKIELEMAVTESVDDEPIYSSENYNCSIREKPNFDLSRIDVIL